MALMVRTPSSWRDPISLRDWTVFAQISVRARHVERIYCGLFVEGRTRWLGSTWVLSAETNGPETRQKAYEVNGSALTFPGNGGAGIIHSLTAAATAEQLQTAHDFNARCLTGLIPCRRLCDLTPRAFQYLNQHPEVGNISATDACLSPNNP